MEVTAYEAIIEDGRVKLSEAVRLPERTRVYVLVPGIEPPRVLHVGSPRLARPEQAADFTMSVSEEPRDAGL